MSKTPVTYDHLKSKKKPIYRSIWLAMDSELAEEEAQLKQRVGVLKVRLAGKPNDQESIDELTESEKRLEKLQKEFRDGLAVKFTFRSIGRRRYDDLISEHQPTDDQKAEVKAMDPNGTLDFNPETFPQALIAASIVTPELTKSEVNDMFQSDDWSGPELSGLFETALLANTTYRILSMGNGSRGTNGSR